MNIGGLLGGQGGKVRGVVQQRVYIMCIESVVWKDKSQPLGEWGLVRRGWMYVSMYYLSTYLPTIGKLKLGRRGTDVGYVFCTLSF